MLQQTTVTAVIPYFERFLRRFPSVEALAGSPEGDVMAAWAGLGYYARARNLHACAKQVVALGGFPRTVAELRDLPGIGAYTAVAIAAIAFGVPGVPMDGNVERVVARLFAITTPLPPGRHIIGAAATRWGEDPDAYARPSDFAQALFDLGATVCTPAAPACGVCPMLRRMPRAAGRDRGRTAAQGRQEAAPPPPRRAFLAHATPPARCCCAAAPPAACSAA